MSLEEQHGFKTLRHLNPTHNVRETEFGTSSIMPVIRKACDRGRLNLVGAIE